MNNNSDLNYNKKISERILRILDLTGLEIKGIAALTGKSIDIFYAVISCRRPLSQDLARVIGKSLNFDGSIIFDMNTPIPMTIKNSSNLLQFRQEHINNKDFFINTWTNDKDSAFIKKHLIYSGYFSTPRYAWEVNRKLERLGRKLDSDLLSKQLKYFVKKEILESKKAALKLKKGGFGKRMVDLYWQKKKRR